MFHPENLFLGVSVVGDVNELAQLWRVDFFEFGGEEHGRGSNQLELPSEHRHLRQEPAILVANNGLCH